ncbi:MAG TPA: protein translocase subunit SecF [Candidatus Paceibacterota bacterium]|nr:protein translocase subunit SecF [Candidatus Paceibacterota bacterium]
MNIVGKRKLWFAFSAVLVGLAIIAIATYGFKLSAEFKGGSLWEFKIPINQPSLADVQGAFSNTLHIDGAQITYDSTNQEFLARFDTVSETSHQQYLKILENTWSSFQELNFESISPSIGAGLLNNAIIAMILVLVGISIYIAFAFRKASRPISSWQYGWITLVTLFHDVSIPAGLLAFLGHTSGVQIDSNFIVALLVVMGFSVHDTIVVFDRIRENLLKQRGREPFVKIVNDSVNQTIARSVNTSLTLILVLLALYFVGPTDLRYFVLTLLVGVTTGIYSSIFIASPLLVAIAPQDIK